MLSMTPHKLNCLLTELEFSINEAKEIAEKHRIIMDALAPYKGALIMRKNQVSELSELRIVDFSYGEYQIRSLLGGYLGAVSFYVPHRSLTPIDYPTAVALEVKLEDLLQQHFESLEVLRHQLHKIHGEIRYLRNEILTLLPNNTFFITPFFSVAKLLNRADLTDGRNLLCYGEIKVVNTVKELFAIRKENE